LVTVFALLFLPAVHVWSAVTVILVRHADVPAGSANPSLTAQGHARATALASMLRDTPLNAIFVSDQLRTQQTAQPAADQAHLQLQKKTEAADLTAAIRARTSGTILVVGHSNTVPQVISMLGGPRFEIGETEFDNLFLLTLNQGQASVVRLRYGTADTAVLPSVHSTERKSIVEISFIKSGGFAGPMTRVQGTVNLKEGKQEVNGDASYHRTLAATETDDIRAGADPSVLPQAAQQIAAIQAKGKATGDVEHYIIRVTASDGKTTEVSLNTTGSSTEMAGVPPAAAKFVQWVRDESRKILTNKMSAK
jgi:broad specificity phosphatase PhoE